MMKIIDAHMHFNAGNPYFNAIAQAASHENTAEHLLAQYQALGIAGGIVMGNGNFALDRHIYPPFLRYCVGVSLRETPKEALPAAMPLLEKHMQAPQCAGIKLYPGYDPFYVTDVAYTPVYELAQQYNIPIAIHTGITANSQSLLKYAHPLTLDELAVRYPAVQFIMCHFGNPWLPDAAAVIMKNENVAADLSGLFEGKPDADALLRDSGYLVQLRAWLGFLGRYDKLLFGTDWPLVNLQANIDIIAGIIPEAHHSKVFFENANRIYRMGL